MCCVCACVVCVHACVCVLCVRCEWDGWGKSDWCEQYCTLHTIPSAVKYL